MKISLKKLLIPSGATKEIDAAKTWTVRWRSQSHRLDFDGTEYAEVFVTNPEAEDFAKSLRDAKALLREGSLKDVTVKANQ